MPLYGPSVPDPVVTLAGWWRSGQEAMHPPPQPQYFEFALDCVRQLYQLELLLKETDEARNVTIARAFSKWEGSSRHFVDSKLKELERCDAHGCADRKSGFGGADGARDTMRGMQDAWIGKWIEAVDSYNSLMHQEAIQDLQTELDALYARAVDEADGGDKLLIIAAQGLDDIVDVASYGLVNLIKDDAAPLVPEPRRIDSRPSPPNYEPDRVFVSYERVDNDPRSGMHASYWSTPDSRSTQFAPGTLA